jgi:transcriptional regulator with XRE-family HTH domain
MNFQKLIELREDFNLKQKDIAKLLNITQQTYSLWENGSKIIPLKHLNSLCNYYNVSMDYMLGLSNKNSFNNGKYNIDKNETKESYINERDTILKKETYK